MSYLPALNFVVLLALVAGGIHLRVHGERAWTGMGQSQELQAIRAEMTILRGNHARLERDVGAWRREGLEVNLSILHELTAMRSGATDGAATMRKIQDLTERIADLEQIVASLPCGACPPGMEKQA